MHTRLPGLYVHIPFCSSRCNYCAFVSGIYDSDKAKAYLDALERELILRSVSERTNFSTLFIGGGTPSILDLPMLEKLLSFIPMPANNGEASCEMNPETVTDEKLSLLHSVGMNRISIGVQTFCQSGLKLLGRKHNAKQAISALTTAAKHGFHSLNLDLIVGWPGQGISQLQEDLRIAVDLGITHISCYNLMLEELTPLPHLLKSAGLSEKKDDEARHFWDMTEETLVQNGFEHYEISNYAKPGYHCRHNVDIWQGGEYFGMGASAHSHYQGRRFSNSDSVDDYIAALHQNTSPEVYSETLNPASKAKECAIFWLRLSEGIDIKEFKEKTSFTVHSLYAVELPLLLAKGVLEIYVNAMNRQLLRFTKDAFPLADSYLMDLV